jgi:hypothetical protein
VLEISSVLWCDATFGDWLRGSDADSRARFIASPSAADIRQLIPWSLASVRATGARTSDDRPRVRQLRDAAGAAALMTVGAASRSRRIEVAGGASLVDEVASALGARGARGIVMCGPARANQKPVVQLHDGRGRTIAFVKVAWNALTKGLLDVEAAALDRLATHTDRGFAVPPALARGTFGDSSWIALGRVAVGRRRRGSVEAADRLALAIESTAPQWTGDTQSAAFVQRVVQATREMAIAGPAADLLCARWSGHPMTLAAAHGDFVPWNILSGTPHPAVWDWERYDTAVPIGFDRLHYRVQIGLHRRQEPITETIARVARQIATILPDLTPAQRQAHLEWYVVDLLARYEGDGVERHGTRWVGLTDQLRASLAELTKEPIR